MNYNTIVNYILLFINLIVIYISIKIYQKEKEIQEEKEEQERIQEEEQERIQEEEQERIQEEEKEEQERIQKEEQVEEKEEQVEEKEEQVEEKEEQVEEKEEQVEEEEVKVEEVVPLENDINTWYKFADGKGRYKGEWKNGLPNGKGTKHSYKDDSYIYGNFVDGYTEGYGKQTFGQTWEKTQPYYEGEFKRNHFHGKGEYHYGDGDYYKGDWKDSKYNGQGAAYSKRLDKTWIGEYKNDEKVEGNWVKGEI
jgi:hypothetical protein